MQATEAVFTRADYMAAALDEQPAAHRRFYAQAVTESLPAYVARYIGAKSIMASTDPHLNDIPLQRWDALQSLIHPHVFAMHKRIGYTGGVSLGDCVCTAKEAARQWKEAQPAVASPRLDGANAAG